MTIIRTHLTLIVTSVLLTACAGGGLLQPFPPVKNTLQLEMLLQPNLNTEATAELGNTFISRRFIQSIPTIQLSSPVSHTTSHNGIPISVYVPVGRLTEWGKGELGTYYQAPGFTATATSVIGQKVDLETTGGIIVPTGATTAKFVYRKPNSSPDAFVSDHDSPINYTTLPNTIVSHKDSFIRELIYTGIAKNTITVVYREFSNDLVRPAFSQELKYDLSEGNVIGFKGARFEVIKATNTEIRYKVLKNLD